MDRNYKYIERLFMKQMHFFIFNSDYLPVKVKSVERKANPKEGNYPV
jgi:hypothetical protein